MARELVNVLKPAQEAAIDDGEFLGGGGPLRPENRIRRGPQGLREADQQRAGIDPVSWTLSERRMADAKSRRPRRRRTKTAKVTTTAKLPNLSLHPLGHE